MKKKIKGMNGEGRRNDEKGRARKRGNSIINREEKEQREGEIEIQMEEIWRMDIERRRERETDRVPNRESQIIVNLAATLFGKMKLRN